jgi:hypothetical protein
MAKYTITYKCGHTVEKQLFGKEVDRQRWIKWAESGDCPDCARAEANAGLIPLVGSEKQVNWAADIRPALIQTVNEWAVKARPKFAADLETKLTQALDHLPTITSAAWWIEHRNTRPDLIASDALKLI